MAAFVRGLLAGLPRVNCWSIAEHASERCPRGMQRLLSAAVWDEAGMRDDLRPLRAGALRRRGRRPGGRDGRHQKGTATAGTQRRTGRNGPLAQQTGTQLACRGPYGPVYRQNSLVTEPEPRSPRNRYFPLRHSSRAVILRRSIPEAALAGLAALVAGTRFLTG
jgi:hypothetical protein